MEAQRRLERVDLLEDKIRLKDQMHIYARAAQQQQKRAQAALAATPDVSFGP
jgi:hypothetical protein